MKSSSILINTSMILVNRSVLLKNARKIWQMTLLNRSLYQYGMSVLTEINDYSLKRYSNSIFTPTHERTTQVRLE